MKALFRAFLILGAVILGVVGVMYVFDEPHNVQEVARIPVGAVDVEEVDGVIILELTDRELLAVTEDEFKALILGAAEIQKVSYLATNILGVGVDQYIVYDVMIADEYYEIKDEIGDIPALDFAY